MSTIDNTAYIPLKNPVNHGNSSYAYLSDFAVINHINKKSILYDIEKMLSHNDYTELKNLVIIDDICGTADTFLKYIKNNLTIFKNKRIFYCVIVVMENAKKRIHDFAKDNGLDIEVLSHEVQKKAFEIQKLKGFKNSYELICNEKKIDQDLIFGYKDSESLVSFYNNTPNNTLALFWQDTIDNKPIFPRKYTPTPFWMNKQKENRRKNNYKVKKYVSR